MKRTSGGLSGDGGAARGAQKGETMAQKTFARPLMFTRQALWRLILPLVLEQLLLVTVGMADTVMVSTVGEAAVSGISLVDQVNVLLIQIFAALATGGAVVASQYLGRRDRENACRSAKQLVYATFGMAVAIGALVLVLNRHILRLVFGNVEPDVMQAAETYFWLSALSYPMLALYNAGAALFRSMGNSRISLFASLIMNVINIGGNALLIYGLNWGVAGAATATLASRTVAGLMMMLLLRNRDNPIFLERLFHPEWNGGILKSILRVGVPNGLENGMFQIGKLLVAGLITTFGVGYRGQCHLQQCRFYVQHPRLGHRPGDDHCGGPVRGRKRLSAGAALYETLLAAAWHEYGPAEYRCSWRRTWWAFTPCRRRPRTLRFLCWVNCVVTRCLSGRPRSHYPTRCARRATPGSRW